VHAIDGVKAASVSLIGTGHTRLYLVGWEVSVVAVRLSYDTDVAGRH
jgi:hypothetical protein